MRSYLLLLIGSSLIGAIAGCGGDKSG